MTEAIHATITRINGNCISLGKENLFINEVNITGFKEFQDVSYTKQGPNLVSIAPYTPPAAPPETRTGGGKITVLDLLNTHLEYSYFYQGAPATSKIFQFSDSVKPKVGQFKVGDEVSVTYSVRDNKKTLEDIGPKQQKKGGWGGQPRDPEAEKRKQESIEKQNARIISKDIINICLQQYPIAADPDNYEKAVSLFPQLMEMVKQGEGILLGGRT